jgi:hypothetical protein
MDAQSLQLPLQLAETLRSQSTTEQSTEMLWAEIHLDRNVAIKRKRSEADRALALANRATFRLGAFD